MLRWYSRPVVLGRARDMSDVVEQLVFVGLGMARSSLFGEQIAVLMSRKGTRNATVVVFGDGALGFSMRCGRFSRYRQRRCWFHDGPISLPRCRNQHLGLVGRPRDRHRRRGGPGVLRVASRALALPAHHTPKESAFAIVRFAHQGHQGSRLACRRNCPGLQAGRRRTSPLAGRRRPRPGRLRESHPPVLTMSRWPRGGCAARWPNPDRVSMP
jgi:hypothetical protein